MVLGIAPAWHWPGLEPGQQASPEGSSEGWPLTPGTPVLVKLPLGAVLVLPPAEGAGVAAVSIWGVPECNRQAGTGHLVGCLPPCFLQDWCQVGRLPGSPYPGTTDPVADPVVSCGRGDLTHAYLCPCLPALPTHLAVLRLLQAEAAGIDFAFSLWIDLDELIALGVPAGLGGLWGTLPSMGKGLESV